jgi:hypothetical protein
MGNKEQNTGMSLEEATKVAVSQSEHLSASEQAMYVAGFQECIKWQSSQPINSELTKLKAENERLKNQLKLFVDAMNALADTTFIINH